MATLPETSVFTAGIYQLETTDPVEGGASGKANQQGKELANRTLWLKNQIEAMAWKTGDIKEVACDAAYIAANFTGTGLGTNERVGWAICNGQNGTINKGGRVGLGYIPTTYPILSQGGNKDAVVIAHTHKVARDEANVNNGQLADFPNNAMATSGANLGSDNYDYELGRATGGDADSGNTSSTGVSATDKNMQPYITVLFIQKI